MGQFPVVGKQEKTFGVIVQTPYGKDPNFESLNELDDRGTISGIMGGGDHAFGLVQSHRDFRLRSADKAIVNADGVFSPGDLGTGLEDHLAVYFHTAFTDPFFGLASRGDSGPG
jgi:hypothetical protein